MTNGQIQLGEPCSYGAACFPHCGYEPCAPGLSCHVDKGPAGTCFYNPRMQGEPCGLEWERCDRGLTCRIDSQICSFGGVLDSCTADFMCDKGLNCDIRQSKCFHSPRHKGEPCADKPGYHCRSGFTCSDELKCSAFWIELFVVLGILMFPLYMGRDMLRRSNPDKASSSQHDTGETDSEEETDEEQPLIELQEMNESIDDGTMEGVADSPDVPVSESKLNEDEDATTSRDLKDYSNGFLSVPP